MALPIVSKEGLRAALDEYGAAVVPAVLNAAECAAMQSSIWDFLEAITAEWPKPISRNDTTTWRSFYDLFPTHGMLLQHWGVGHAQASWDVRQNPKVVDIFRHFYGRSDLLTSFDGLSFSIPPEQTGRGWHRKDWLHTDQSYTTPDFACVQAWATALDVQDGDATLVLLRGSHKHHREFAQTFGITDKSNWFKLNETQQAWYAAKGCNPIRVHCKAGDMVFWDSRTIHCGQGPVKGRTHPKFRMVTYVSMQPKDMASQTDLKRKREAFQAGRTTSHWAAKTKLFAKMPRTYGKKTPATKAPPPPILTDLGRSLAAL